MIAAPAGRWDTHCHVSPCLLPRWGTALDVARAARARHYEGIVLFAHHSATYREAAVARQVTAGVRVIGSVTLNRACGGLTLDCVRAHLAGGVRVFSLPTFDAAAHVRVLGAGRSLGGQVIADLTDEGIALLERGRISAAVLRLLDLLAEHRAVLCSGHIDAEELEALVAETAVRALPLIVNHPYFLAHPPLSFWNALPHDARVQLAAVSDPSDHRLPPLDAVLDVVARVGVQRCMIGSQASAPNDPLQRVEEFCSQLQAAGLSADDIRHMTTTTPHAFFNALVPEVQ